ncbi:MAG TPA: DedA family protein [Tepidisphaeraceae bacterium]|jgi:membrane protein DedA with SNARE-associated domain|nr:DedA family protein [Tepidisphaeraceae bacterium]
MHILLISLPHINIEHLLEHGSYLVLFLLLFGCGLGLPLPEDIPLLLSGAFAAQGRMNLAIAAVCAWFGIVGGDIVLYHLGKKFGLEVRRLPLIGRHLSQKRIEKVHRLFEKYGVWVVAVGRLFAGIRGAMVVVAGTIRFTFWKFLLADGLAAVVSGGMFLLLGYWFGSNMHRLMDYVHQGKKWTLLVAVVAAIVGGIWIYLHQKNSDEETPAPAERPQPANLPESAAE